MNGYGGYFTDPDGNEFAGELHFFGGLNLSQRVIDIYAVVKELGPNPSLCREFSVDLKLDRHIPHTQSQVTFRLESRPHGAQAQELMDLLWRSNVRPADGGSIGQTSAMQAHLADLQKLVFDPERGPSPLKAALDHVADLQRQLEQANKTIQSLLSPVFFHHGDPYPFVPKDSPHA